MRRILLIILLLTVSATYIHSQNQVKIRYKNKRLDSVLMDFSSKYNMKFAFDQELAEMRYVNGTFSARTFVNLAERIIKSSSFDIEIINGTYVLYPVLNADRQSQNFTIKGIIKDRATGESLPFANIYSTDYTMSTVTNQDGYFTLFEVTDSTLLQISYLGYKSQIIRMDSIQKNTIVTFFLSASSSEISEVIVKGESETMQIEKYSGLSTLNPSRLKYLPNTGESDVFKLVQLMPGVKATSESSSDLVIRGGTMDQNLILFDDFSIYHIDHFYGMFSVINPKVVKNVQLFKGGFDAIYGSKINSVISITGKSGNSNSMSVDIGINPITSNLLFETPIAKRGTFLIAARRSLSDINHNKFYSDLVEQVKKSNYGLFLSYSEENDTIKAADKPDFYFYDVNSKLSFDISDSKNISLSYFTSRDVFKRDNDGIGETVQIDDRLGNDGFSIRFRSKWNSKWYSKFVYTYSNYFNDFLEPRVFYYYDQDGERVDDVYVMENHNKLKESSFKIKNTINLNNSQSINWGVESFLYNVKHDQSYYIDDYTYEYLDFIEESDLLSFYLQGNFEFKSKFEVKVGSRINYYNELNSFHFEPRIKLGYKLSKYTTFRASYGVYYQYLSRINVGWLPNSVQSFWLISDEENIPVSKSDHFATGFNFRKDGWTFDLEFYMKNYKDIVKYVYDYSDDHPESIFSYGGNFIEGKSEITGLDVILSKKYKDFYGWLSYTGGKNINVFERLNNESSFPNINNQKHEFKVAGMQGIKNFNIACSWIYGSGFKYDNPYSFLEEADNEELGGKLKNYHRLDLNLSYSLQIKRFSFDVGVSFLNVYDRRNEKSTEMAPLIYNGETHYDLDRVSLQGFTTTGYLNIKF